MSCRLNNVSERDKILRDLQRDFSEPFVYHGCICNKKEDLLKAFSDWDGFFIHVDNVRYAYRNAEFNDNGKTFKKPVPKWYQDKYINDFNGPLPHEEIRLM
jgi:hypothetical protein